MWSFFVKFSPKGQIQSDFYQIKCGLGDGVPGSHLRAKFHHSGFKNVGLQPQKSQKVAIIGINLHLMENLGVHRKN